jgi:hypothetical protein
VRFVRVSLDDYRGVPMAETQPRNGQVPSPRSYPTTPSWTRSLATCVTAWLVDALVAWEPFGQLGLDTRQRRRDTYWRSHSTFRSAFSPSARVCRNCERNALPANSPAVITRAAVAVVTVLGVVANLVVVAQLPTSGGDRQCTALLRCLITGRRRSPGRCWSASDRSPELIEHHRDRVALHRFRPQFVVANDAHQ